LLYSEAEDYNILKITMSQFLNDLWSIKEDGISDWKFLAICLGLNAANSLHFCPWCLCSKQQYKDLSKDWQITKTMNE
ncbi:20737_t:CDS:2, partial [Cetraspora pellucida]